jgi:hypothetical protein
MIVHIKTGMGKTDNLLFRIGNFLHKIFIPIKTELNLIPVIINNFNRLEWLLLQLDWLEKAGLKKIYIIDNDSTYEPLLKFYKKTNYIVYKLDKNIGHEALWRTILFQKFSRNYYVYTDPDIIPIQECPFNILEKFMLLLKKYPSIEKVGFGLKTDDLPESYPLTVKVINWEKQFWQNEIEKNVYETIIDTTFALYPPGVKGGATLKALRTGFPYLARHMSWYINPLSLNPEEEHFIKNASQSSSWTMELFDKKRDLHY